MPRPLLESKVADLESLFEAGREDLETLRALEIELAEHRETNRAERLLAKVREALAERPADAVQTEGWSSRYALIDFGALEGFRPLEANGPQEILATWRALEALSPQSFSRFEDLLSGRQQSLVKLAGEPPWLKGEVPPPNFELYYQVVFGTIVMDRASELLIQAFGEQEESSRSLNTKAAIAAVLIDSDGVVLESKGVAISSFAWALPLALRQELGSLGSWPMVEPRLVQALSELLRGPAGGKLDSATLDAAFDWLVRQLGLSNELVEPPRFAVQIHHSLKAKAPPEPLLLNSFFLNDLARAAKLAEKQSLPTTLRSFLALDRSSQTTNLLTDLAALEQAVAPALTPAARWPAPGGHPLVLLQQAAVNLARRELAGGKGLVAINGPPGTGKTTLLRDLVAATVLDRASAMAAFERPEEAFASSGREITIGKAFLNLYRLHPSLKGHELVVASSNNRAVENVSRELPAAKAIGRSTAELSYFKALSDHVYADDDSEENPGRPPSEPFETWGMIAAILGNARNRSAFQQKFWWHKDRGFWVYLRAVRGDSVVEEFKDDSGKVVKRTIPQIVELERPPSAEQALAKWREAKTRFLALRSVVAERLGALENLRQLCLQLPSLQKEVDDQEAALSTWRSQVETAQEESRRAAVEAMRCRTLLEERQATSASSLGRRPGFFARLLRTQSWKVWDQGHTPLAAAERDAESTFAAANDLFRTAETKLERAQAAFSALERRVAFLQETLRQKSEEIDAWRPLLGERIVDAAFFAAGHEKSNLRAPWLPDDLHRLREDLFIAAMELHRAFVDAAAQKLLHNLSALMIVMNDGPPPDEERRALVGDLWSSLFLVVPLISTTFSSVERMFDPLPAGSIGWLLIDEAGQAVPQAAVGALLRARRTIVVGDPMQIPPVVSLPPRLVAEICRFFHVDPTLWAGPEASVQGVADRASDYQSGFRTDQGQRLVGIPLLVHRRCQEPMFGISNRIAYDGQMVHAPSPKMTSAVEQVLGSSAFFAVDGEAISKWCPAEGDIVVSLLGKLAAAGVVDPDLFIITPFRTVATELREQLQREKELGRQLGIDFSLWTSERVGTIHTFQGREAESVILVLGAPSAKQTGARTWAAGTPNILNVAASRAKHNFYVVGSHVSWTTVGYARELRCLPLANASSA